MRNDRKFSVALVGPDGVGKTTIARHLEAHSGLPIKYLYMGDNPRASNVSLPTTRWYQAYKARRAARNGGAPSSNGSHKGRSPRRLARTLLRPARKSLGLAHRVAEESYRGWIASTFARRGFIVVYDRHFLLDYWHSDIGPTASRSLRRRMHGYLLQRVLQEPDLVICLDVPGEVAWRRKGELTPEILERRRSQYRQLAERVHHFALVDADRPLERVIGDVCDCIVRFGADLEHASL